MQRMLESFRQNEQWSMWASYLCVAGMLACVGSTAMLLGERLMPATTFDLLPWTSLLVAIEAMFSNYQTRRQADVNTNVPVYRAVEWVLILAVLKLVTWLGMDLSTVQAELQAWQQNFGEAFLTASYVFLVFSTAVVWALSTAFAQDLAELQGDELLLSREGTLGMAYSRDPLRRRIAARLFTTGGVMVFLTALVRLDIARPLGGLLPSRHGLGFLVVYFIFGLLLLSLAQLAMQRGVWAWEHVPVREGLSRQWITYSFLFLLVLAVFSFLLPTNYTVRLLPIAGYLIGLVVGGLFFLGVLILIPFFYLIAWLMRPLGVHLRAPQALANPVSVLPQGMPAEKFVIPPWVEILRSVLFWGVIALVVGYSIYIYINQNKDLKGKLQRLPGMGWMVKAWRWIVLQFNQGKASLSQAVAASAQKVRTALRRRGIQPITAIFRLRNASPRQQVYFYYSAMLRRGAQAQIPRHPWQTPTEYARRLSQDIPQGEEPIQEMTEGFTQARYSQLPVHEQHARRVKSAWERLRQSLRELRKREKDG